jgi:DNA-binding NtrC family response regulator
MTGMQTPKAWVIDKDPNFQTYLHAFLDTIGYSAKCFTDGEESLQHLKEKPAFIILDKNLNGDLNGLDVLRTIKVNTAIPLIYISSDERQTLTSEACKCTIIENIENEGALLRLRTRIEKVEKIKSLKLKRRKSKILIFSIIGLIWAAGLLKLAFNVSL